MSAALQTFRERFTERFPSAEREYAETLIVIAECIVGEDPIPSETAEGLLLVAAAKLTGQAWDPDSLPMQPSVVSPLRLAAASQDRNGFIGEAFRRLESASNRAPSGRPVVRGSVYCVQQLSGGLIKIGFSTDVGARIATLNGSGPEKLNLLAHTRTYDFVEKDLHAYLGEHRVHCEWFADAPEVLDVVRNLAAHCRRCEKARSQDLPAPKEPS